MTTNPRERDDATQEKGKESGAGAPETTQTAGQQQDENAIWVMSNRQDDRVVLFERDPRHPGGEAFVGGSAPDKVFRTAEVERLMHTGELIQIPEPPDGPKKPKDVAPVVSQAPPAMPGQPVRLGRQLDPDLVPAEAQGEVRARQRAAPRQLASKAGVPPLPQSERTETRT